MKDTAYWWEAAPPIDHPEQALPKQTDIAIIGAGFAGLSAALTLARAGRSVQVFEAEHLGEGASTRNGGIASGNLRPSLQKLIDRFGLERGKAIYLEGKQAREDLIQFLQDENIECGFSLTGRFSGANRARHYEHFARDAELLKRHLGIEAQVIPKAEQHRFIGSDLYHGGLLRPDVGGLHPGLFHKGLLDRVLATEAVVHAKAPVSGIRRERKHFEVQSTRGALQAQEVIVATNGYTDGALPWLQRRIVPIPSQVIATEPLPPELLDKLIPGRHMLGETRNMYHYFRPSPDGTGIVFGGRRGASNDDLKVKSAGLYQDLIAIFPDLKGVGISHSWWGYTGFTFDFLPKLTVHDGVHYATGFCGSGVVWAPWIGRKAALRILGQPGAETAFADVTFQTRPLYRGRPWFLPAIESWYGLKDRLGQ